ncbi:hypothetical protein SDC9_197025 [bioreactor metagenome]|uniref:Uncharacterized protein n=1 Tax=bioreactor metagenome TaxID=1076179 RepID=A0A645IM63_9ZZZZ
MPALRGRLHPVVRIIYNHLPGNTVNLHRHVIETTCRHYPCKYGREQDNGSYDNKSMRYFFEHDEVKL